MHPLPASESSADEHVLEEVVSEPTTPSEKKAKEIAKNDG
jgi:hypothetical protein